VPETDEASDPASKFPPAPCEPSRRLRVLGVFLANPNMLPQNDSSRAVVALLLLFELNELFYFLRA
jgi:hypothetical protein